MFCEKCQNDVRNFENYCCCGTLICTDCHTQYHKINGKYIEGHNSNCDGWSFIFYELDGVIDGVTHDIHDIHDVGIDTNTNIILTN